MQVWLALNNLLVDPGCREKALQQNSHGVESLQRVRRHMNEVLLDQLPVLADLQRVLDELAMGCSGLPHNAHASLIIEQVPPYHCDKKIYLLPLEIWMLWVLLS